MTSLCEIAYKKFRLRNCVWNTAAFIRTVPVVWNHGIHSAVGVHLKSDAPFEMHATRMHRINDGCHWVQVISALTLKWCYRIKFQSIKWRASNWSFAFCLNCRQMQNTNVFSAIQRQSMQPFLKMVYPVRRHPLTIAQSFLLKRIMCWCHSVCAAQKQTKISCQEVSPSLIAHAMTRAVNAYRANGIVIGVFMIIAACIIQQPVGIQQVSSANQRFVTSLTLAITQSQFFFMQILIAHHYYVFLYVSMFITVVPTLQTKCKQWTNFIVESSAKRNQIWDWKSTKTAKRTHRIPLHC